MALKIDIYRSCKPVDTRLIDISGKTISEIIQELGTEFKKAKKNIFAVTIHLDGNLLLPTEENEKLIPKDDSQLIIIQDMSTNVVSKTEQRIVWWFSPDI